MSGSSKKSGKRTSKSVAGKTSEQRVLHFDAFSGASGNMILGVLFDLGLTRKALLEGLDPLGLEFKLVAKKVQRSAFAARYVDIRLPSRKATKGGAAASRQGGKRTGKQNHVHDDRAHAHGKHYVEIRRLLERAKLATPVKARSLEIFAALARAEAKVHGTSIEDVHFHEVGAVDAIVDIAGAAIGIEALGIDRVTCTPIALGHGEIDSDHGVLPLPAPATLELLEGIPTSPAHVEWETLTPTGAAILRTVVDDFGWLPAMIVEKVGYGAGNDREGRLPNVLRGVLGRSGRIQGDRIICIETNLDDLVPEHFDYVMERLFEAGALDVSIQHLQMKKNRPGFLLRVLAKPSDRDELARIVFAESTAIGVRLSEWDRLVLERERVRLKTEFGVIAVKQIRGPDGDFTFSPEYDDCKRAARKANRPLREVVRIVSEQAARECAG